MSINNKKDLKWNFKLQLASVHCKDRHLRLSGDFHFSWNLFSSCPPLFAQVVKSCWLQHMPDLPIFLLETSNIHNFWFVGPKIAFFFPAKLIARRMFIKSFKNLKIVCTQVTRTKTGLSAVRTFSPLGIKCIPLWATMTNL
jgi:hypothetical protein